LGNILSGYEQYPLNRYGMPSVFYWPRLWLQVEPEKKDAIDGAWSIADGFLSLSAVSFVGFVSWTIAAIIGSFEVLPSNHLPLRQPILAFLAGLGWLVLGYAFYRLSLPFHRANGEVFKSLFDLYREKIRTLTKLEAGEKEAWRAAWGYLQYLRIRCPNKECARLTPFATGTCTYCGAELKQLIERMKISGEFPGC
jgi:hypothetical protein